MSVASRSLTEVTLAAGVALAAAAWPLSAYKFGPLLLPLMVGAVLVVVAVLQRPAAGIATVLALSPFINANLGDPAPGADSSGEPFQVLLPLIAVGTLAYAAAVSEDRWVRELRMLTVGVGALLVATVISAVFAWAPAESINKLLLVVTGAAVFASVPLACRTRRDLVIVIGGATCGLLAAAVHGLYQEAAGVYSTEGFVASFEVVGRIEGAFGHPNLFGGYLAMLIPLGAAVALSTAMPSQLRVLGAVATVLALPALYFTFGRGAMLGLLAAATLWLGIIRPKLAFGLVTAVVVAAVLAMPATLKDRFDPGTSEGDATLRSDIWLAALDIYDNRPLTGVGIDNFAVAYERLPSTSASASQRRLLHQDQLLVPPHPQNMYLQALSEQGIIGLASLLVFIVAGLTATFRASRSPDPFSKTLGVAVGIGFLSLLLHGFLEVPLMGEALLPILALLAATAVALGQASPARDSLSA